LVVYTVAAEINGKVDDKFVGEKNFAVVGNYVVLCSLRVGRERDFG
jgi:hypothetical protein